MLTGIIIGAILIWVAVSIPVALLVGRIARRRDTVEHNPPARRAR
ncbi:hypothetical protein [Gordonia jinhuaensis]|nr:hypothetical protein [Gordonia jinhuaensis]